jgi:hypothetical protein
MNSYFAMGVKIKYAPELINLQSVCLIWKSFLYSEQVCRRASEEKNMVLMMFNFEIIVINFVKPLVSAQ